MSAFKNIGASLARAELAVARSLGERIEFQHRDTACQSLWASMADEEIAVVEEDGIQTETRTRMFTIPIQEGFNATDNIQEPVLPGDKIRHDERDYYVLEGGISKVSNDSVYKVMCIQRKRLASGTS